MDSINRIERRPTGLTKRYEKREKIKEYYGENVFDFKKARGISDKIKREVMEFSKRGETLPKHYVELIAEAVTDWATSKGATHFCHWFQPLTGNSAEKHDSFLTFDKNKLPISALGANELIQGEPDASSFPHGGLRTTFEARGYTIWDLSSPMFIREGTNGRILCIPTAFVSYHGEALDVKTPLLRSINKISEVVTNFLKIIGDDVSDVSVNCGAEQEYFLVDKSFFYNREDLVMSGRTLVGALPAKNQQLSDHYFGSVPDRVLSFMQELDYELYRVGIPSKTRHNEVAPGQFEIAPIFCEANVAADNNQVIMALIKSIARKHNFVALLHEKPFSGINGSGKHLNWSLADNKGRNLLDPGEGTNKNYRFLAIVAVIVEAIHRHADFLRMSVATHSNDHRLGGHEAPPSIMSVFLGQDLSKIYDSIITGSEFTPEVLDKLNLGTDKLAALFKHNTDRNRTSPFAFTGNRFEFRAVGSSQPVGFPLSILNAAVASVFMETNEFIKEKIEEGESIDQVLVSIIRKYGEALNKRVFNGDGYSEDWVQEAKKRGLKNIENAVEAYTILKDESKFDFLIKTEVLRENELKTRFNVFTERYIQMSVIELSTLNQMVSKHIIPSLMNYKNLLLSIMEKSLVLDVKSRVEQDAYEDMEELTFKLENSNALLGDSIVSLSGDLRGDSSIIIEKLNPLSLEIESLCNKAEESVPSSFWTLPTHYQMLFIH